MGSVGEGLWCTGELTFLKDLEPLVVSKAQYLMVCIR
jgi:hypothetical protein